MTFNHALSKLRIKISRHRKHFGTRETNYPKLTKFKIQNTDYPYADSIAETLFFLLFHNNTGENFNLSSSFKAGPHQQHTNEELWKFESPNMCLRCSIYI